MAKKILIAEDDTSLSKALRLKLKSLGFEVDVAEDGEAALTLIRSKSFDLMLLDLMMPQLDGFGVLEELKKVKHRPVVFVNSNLSQASDKARAMKLGADEYLVKSDVSLKEIVEKITKALK
jgi:OmpR family response regulator RpaB